MKTAYKIIPILAFFAHIASADEVLKIAPVGVTGVRDSLSERQDSNTHKVMVNRQDIENMSVMTIGEVLNKLPGVEIKDGGQRARGMSRDSIQIMIDGEKQSRSAMACYLVCQPVRLIVWKVIGALQLSLEVVPRLPLILC